MNDNLHKRISNQFGKDCLDLVRKLEKTSRKLADYRNHLRFNLRCLHTKITPQSLWIKPLVKGHKAKKIIARAQKDLLNERIRQNNFTISVLTVESDRISECLRAQLPGCVYKEISEFIAHAQLTQHRVTKERQQGKYDRLRNSAPSRSDLDSDWRNYRSTGSQPEDGFKDKWIKNLSSRPLSVTEKEVLAKGLNFAVSPDRIPHVELITATESAIKHNNLSTSDADQLRNKVTSCLASAKLPNPNLDKQQRDAIKTLGSDDDIIILPADKGRCTVVLDKPMIGRYVIC